MLPKKIVTEAERLELATKLDKELDQFIESLPRRNRSDEPQIPFDRWEEEIANHPFFMKETPLPGSKLHPLYEGLQKLKYDPEENEPEDLALSYKEDGNFNYKHRNYRMAIISYTEGIRAKCGNADIESTLYNNRAASHYFLKNYRSSLLDCETALKLKPNYAKTMVRAANCCFKMEKYDKCVEFCDKILETDKENREILDLRKNSLNALKVKERNRRKRELQSLKIQKEEDMLVAEILKRQIKIGGGKNNLSLAKLEPQFPQLFDSRVSINGETGRLVWPVVFFYPEYKIMDYIQHFDEDTIFQDQMNCVFANFPEWDLERKYTAGALNVYFEDDVTTKNIKIDTGRTLGEILTMERFVLRDGTPRFIILVANSKVEQQFLGR